MVHTRLHVVTIVIKPFFYRGYQGLYPRYSRCRCPVYVARMWQLDSRRRLFQIACQPGTSEGAERDGNHCARDWDYGEDGV